MGRLKAAVGSRKEFHAEALVHLKSMEGGAKKHQRGRQADARASPPSGGSDTDESLSDHTSSQTGIAHPMCGGGGVHMCA